MNHVSGGRTPRPRVYLDSGGRRMIRIKESRLSFDVAKLKGKGWTVKVDK